MKKLAFLADTLVKEEKLIELGITTFVYKDVIEDYINNVDENVVKIIELSRYTREVPDTLTETIEKCRNIFDELYVIFTDYTGKEERKVAKERRDKDPILFGVFKTQRNISDRFYFLGDWVDEYCDLTLDKMVEKYTNKKGYSPTIDVNVPNTAEEVVDILATYIANETKKGNFTIVDNIDVETTFYNINNSSIGKKRNNIKFSKVRSIFKKMKHDTKQY